MEYLVERQAWPSGPWDHEPDRVEFEHSGLPCMLIRNRMGTWCGYAAVNPGHALHGAELGHETLDGVPVYGGISYTGACNGHICHVPKPGQPEDVWWFGFDCNHAFDLSPVALAHLGGAVEGACYRDTEFATRETKRLAEFLASVDE